MRVTLTTLLILITSGWFPGAGYAQRDQPADLQPKTFTLKGSRKLNRWLKLLSELSGNRIIDRRRSKDNPELSLDLDNTTFWQALERIASKSDTGFSPYFDRGAIAIVEAPYNDVPVSHQGMFRIAVKKISVTRDFETDAHTCQIKLEIAWEPKLQPLYCGVGAVQADFTKTSSARIAPRGDVSVAGRNAIEIDLRLPAPARSVKALKHLRGKLSILAPTEMLAFTFDGLKTIRKKSEQRKQTKEGVSVTLAGLSSDVDTWSVDLLIDNPPSTPQFDSYQSWLTNNRIYLQKGPTTYTTVAPGPANASAEKATAKYYFTDDASKTLSRSKLQDWSLVYVTPGPIVRVDVPFDFKDLPLP